MRTLPSATFVMANDMAPWLMGLVHGFPSGLTGQEATQAEWVENRVMSAARAGLTSRAIRKWPRLLAKENPVMVITGLEATIAGLPPTPVDRVPREQSRLGPWDAVHLAVAAMLGGTVYGCLHTHDGRLVHDVMLKPGVRSNSAYSLGGFGGHVDGAMDPPTAPDWFSLQCLRPGTGGPTFLSAPRRQDFDDKTWRYLTDPVWTIRSDRDRCDPTDLAGVPIMETGTDEQVQRIYYYDDPERLRLDGLPTEDQVPYRAALRAFEVVVEEGAMHLTLKAGDIVLVDNRRIVHGRRPAGGTDGGGRWMRRLWLTTDPVWAELLRQTPERLAVSTRGPGRI